MDGAMSVVEKAATAAADADDEDTAVATIVSRRAVTARQARRTDEDLRDHDLEEGRRLAVAGGGLAKAVILQVPFFLDSVDGEL